MAAADWILTFVYLFFLRLQESHMCAVLVSEENEEPIIIEDKKSGEDLVM